MADEIITQKFLKKFFRYEDGNLYVKKELPRKATVEYDENGTLILKRQLPKRKVGEKIGTTHKNGYSKALILSKMYGLHRLIFLYHYGYFPKEVDHIDNNIQNNKIENLRDASKVQNCYNRRLGTNNTSGVKGVSWSKVRNKWVAQLTVDGKLKRFGFYNDIDYAKFVIEAMRYKYHGKFANNG
jgi:hypothetical protein